MEVPNRNSYWVVEGQLLAGEYPAPGPDEERRTRLNGLLDAGIRSFLDLTETHELRPYQALLKELASERGVGVQYRCMSIPDRGIPSVDQMNAILRHIGDEIGAGRPVYVHCWGGIGRTGTVVGCWMIEQGTCAAMDAIARIAHLRRLLPYQAASPESQEQVDFVHAWMSSKTGRQR